MGRKSGGTQRVQQESTVTQKSFPDELMPYMQKSLQMADALMQQDYIPYGGRRVAGFTPQEQAAFTGVQAIANRALPGVSAGKTYFSNLAGRTGAPTSGTDYLGVSSGYAPGTISSGYTGSDFTSGFNARDFDSAYRPGEIRSTYRPGEFSAQRSTANIDEYMNPYTERVLDRQLARRQKAFQERRAQERARDTAAGGASAFGGRGLLQQQTAQTAFDEGTADIEASALDRAYQQALTASSRDIDRDLRVQQLRDQAERTRAQMGLTAAQSRDAAERARAQMATRAQEATARFGQAAGAQDIQAQIASDAAARAAGLQNLQAQQMADRSAETAAKLGLTAQQYADLSRRSAGEQGLRAAIATDAAARAAGDQDLRAALANQRAFAAALGRRDAAARYGVDLDKTEQAMDLQRVAALAQAGQDIRGLQQRGLDMAYQDFIRQRDYPREMLAFYSNLMKQNVSALGPNQTQTTTSPAPSRLGQMANLGLGALALGRGRTV